MKKPHLCLFLAFALVGGALAGDYADFQKEIKAAKTKAAEVVACKKALRSKSFKTRDAGEKHLASIANLKPTRSTAVLQLECAELLKNEGNWTPVGVQLVRTSVWAQKHALVVIRGELLTPELRRLDKVILKAREELSKASTALERTRDRLKKREENLEKDTAKFEARQKRVKDLILSYEEAVNRVKKLEAKRKSDFARLKAFQRQYKQQSIELLEIYERTEAELKRARRLVKPAKKAAEKAGKALKKSGGLSPADVIERYKGYVKRHGKDVVDAQFVFYEAELKQEQEQERSDQLVLKARNEATKAWKVFVDAIKLVQKPAR